MKRPDRRARASAANDRRDWYRIRNSSEEDTGPVEILIYDEIGYGWYGGVSAQDFARDLSAIDSDEITVRLNSPGGDVFDGIAILNALRAHKAKVTVYVDGLAASAASFIAMAGDEIVMRRNSELMIHDAWGFCAGNADEMRSMAGELDRVSNNIASIYADRTGGTVDDWRTVMKEEVWYSDQEAVDAGLADRVESKSSGGDAEDKTDAKAKFDLSIFNYAGRKEAPAPKALAAKASKAVTESSAADTITHEGGSDVAFTDEQTGELREALSLSEDATDQEIFDAVLEKLTAPEGDGGEETAASAMAKLPAGVVAVESAVLDGLRRDAARGAEARAQQEQDARAALVSAAIKDGRIPTARKQHWLDALKADPEGSAAALASLAPGLIPVQELGHGVDTGASNSADLGWFDTAPAAPAEKKGA